VNRGPPDPRHGIYGVRCSNWARISRAHDPRNRAREKGKQPHDPRARSATVAVGAEDRALIFLSLQRTRVPDRCDLSVKHVSGHFLGVFSNATSGSFAALKLGEVSELSVETVGVDPRLSHTSAQDPGVSHTSAQDSGKSVFPEEKMSRKDGSGSKVKV